MRRTPADRRPRRHAARRHHRARADRVADAVVPRLAARSSSSARREQYVNGTVSIGSLGGNLFYGVQLGDVAIDVNGERVVTLKNGRDQVQRLASSSRRASRSARSGWRSRYILARRDAGGWNLAKMMKKQAAGSGSQGTAQADLAAVDRDRQRPRRRSTTATPSPTYRYPSRIDGAERQGRASSTRRCTTASRSISSSFAGKAPDLTVQKLAGRIGTRDDDLNVEKLFLQTAQSSLTFDGVDPQLPGEAVAAADRRRRRSSRCPSSAACCRSCRATTCTRRST